MLVVSDVAVLVCQLLCFVGGFGCGFWLAWEEGWERLCVVLGRNLIQEKAPFQALKESWTSGLGGIEFEGILP